MHYVALALLLVAVALQLKTMSAISDYVAKVGPKLTRIQTGLDAVQALVEKFQSTPGVLTPEDQALLDQLETQIDTIAGDADSVPAAPTVPAPTP